MWPNPQDPQKTADLVTFTGKPLMGNYSSLWVTFLDLGKLLLVDVLPVKVCIVFYLSFQWLT